MKKDKVLLQIASLEAIEKYEKLGITNFLFPLKNYSIGYDSFTLEEIKKTGVNAYILANKLLTDDDIDAFEALEIPANVRGFVIEDTGLYVALKDFGYTLINFQNHLNANHETCLYWLKYFDSLVISTDITAEEIENIVDHATAPLVLNTFGYPMIMYSRRHLISNYYENFKLEKKNRITIKDPKDKFTFWLYETEDGTACFDSHILDVREFASRLPEDKILFYLVNASHIAEEDVVKALTGEPVENASTGFLNRKTVYRVGDLK